MQINFGRGERGEKEKKKKSEGHTKSNAPFSAHLVHNVKIGKTKQVHIKIEPIKEKTAGRGGWESGEEGTLPNTRGVGAQDPTPSQTYLVSVQRKTTGVNWNRL